MGKRAALLPAAGHGRGAQLLPICPIARAGSCPQIAARTRKAHAALSFSLKRSEPLFLGLDQLLHQFADLPGLLLRDVDVLDHRALELDAVDCAAVLDEAQRQGRSEEHTSELQSPCNLVCRLLLEKKKNYVSTVRT